VGVSLRHGRFHLIGVSDVQFQRQNSCAKFFGREDGFIHRLLFGYPEDQPMEWSDNGLSDQSRDIYRRIVEKLTRIGFRCHPVRLSRDAYEVWVGWVNGHFREINTLPANLRGPWSKLTAYCARFTLILHHLHCASDNTSAQEVEGESVAGAIKLVNYFKQNARRAYARLHATAEDQQIAAVLTWMRRTSRTSVSARDLVTCRVAHCRDADTAKKLVAILMERGFGTISDSKSAMGGRPSLVFTLNRPFAE
jgi:Protein of unknown function (DUF3987)